MIEFREEELHQDLDPFCKVCSRSYDVSPRTINTRSHAKRLGATRYGRGKCDECMGYFKDAESRFDKLADKIAKEYRKDGDSAEKAKEIGEATAAKIGRAKYGPRRFAEMAHDSESFEADFQHDAMCGHPNEVDCMSCGKVLCWDCTGVEVFDETWTDEQGTFTNKLELCRKCCDHKEKYGAESWPVAEVDVQHIKDLGNSFDDDWGLPEETYSATWSIINQGMGPNTAMKWTRAMEGQDNRFYLEEPFDFGLPPYDAESFEAEKIKGQTQSNIAAKFFVGFDRKGELVGRGKFKTYASALKKAKMVAKKDGNSRVVSPNGAALWMSNGKGLFQAGKLTAQAKEFYDAEEMADAYLAAEEEYFGADGHSSWEDAWGEDIEIDSRDLWNPERAAIDEIRSNRRLREEIESQGISIGRHPGYYDDSGVWIEREGYHDYDSSPEVPLWAQVGLVIGVVGGITYAAKKGWLGE